MKRKDLINGWWLLRSGANHDIYINGQDIEPIPRHREINELFPQKTRARIKFPPWEVFSMKRVYRVVLTPAEIGYVVYVPDLKINTEGENLSDAISMARDAIGLWGITQEDLGRKIPEPTLQAQQEAQDEIVTLVDIDFSAYRRVHDNRAVRKNLTIPRWLNAEAEKEDVNFSQVLQDALKEYLDIYEPRNQR